MKKVLINTLTFNENQRDTLCEILQKELDSWFEFYRDDSIAIAELENYTCFQLLKQMNWPLEKEIKIIEKAKGELASQEEVEV
tara:strand:+ start:45 stop:293 length:249 start_codon:yes stop_codon:yes gene_type:complete